MLTIKSITVENFRGIRIPLRMDLYKNGSPTSAILYGRNGTGKSSIVDAWEWLVNFEIKDLQKEGISTNDYPHKLSNGDGCSIIVEFAGQQNLNIVSATFNKKKITTPILTGDYSTFKTYARYPNFLRYADLQEFVYFSKTDKYKFIARFFGLEAFMRNQTDIQASISRLKGQLNQLSTSLEQTINKIKVFIPRELINDNSVIEFINIIARRHLFNEITDFKQARSVKSVLDGLVKANPTATSLAGWLSFQTRLNNFYPLPGIIQKTKQLEEVFIALKKDEKHVTQLILINLYEKSMTVLANFDDKTKCPLCDAIFDGDLIQHIHAKHKALKELQELKNDYDAKRQSLEQSIISISRKLTTIESENNSIVLNALESFFKLINQAATSMPAMTSIINIPIAELPVLEISTQPSVALTSALEKQELIVKGICTNQINILNNDATSKNLANDLTSLSQLIPAYTDYLKIKAKEKYLINVLQKLDATYTKLTSFIQVQIQNTFTSIQTDVADCYNLLEESNLFLKNPTVQLLAGKDRAVELEIEFVGNKTIPAFKVMSESQVNSFGLSIFLASVKYFNSDFKFIILDDVVNSFDAFKRPKVAKLLHQKFNDFQCLLLTHDQIFSDTVQKVFPNWQRYKFTGWDYTTGPKFRLSRNYKEEIQHHIDQDEPIIAGQYLGRYLEWLLGSVNEKLGTAIPYKTEGAYTLSEFYDPMVARIKSKLKQSWSTHKLVTLFDNIEQGTIFRNYCAHWKDEATPFTNDEIDEVFKKWIEIENLLFCDACKECVEHTKSGSAEYIKCSCGALNLKNTSFYI